jgi:PRC-barrel domain protein
MATFNIHKNPSSRLTGAITVRGSSVFNISFEELGRIEDIIIKEPVGRIAFAILYMGRFLGIGAHHYPLPWEELQSNVEMDGYIVDVDRNVREGKSSYADWTTASQDD